MKINLAGLIKGCQEDLRSKKKGMYADRHAYCLGGLEEHIRGVVSGKYTIEQFAELYCIDRASHKQEG